MSAIHSGGLGKFDKFDKEALDLHHVSLDGRRVVARADHAPVCIARLDALTADELLGGPTFMATIVCNIFVIALMSASPLPAAR